MEYVGLTEDVAVESDASIKSEKLKPRRWRGIRPHDTDATCSVTARNCTSSERLSMEQSCQKFHTVVCAAGKPHYAVSRPM